MIKFMQNLAFHAKFMSKKPSSEWFVGGSAKRMSILKVSDDISN